MSGSSRLAAGLISGTSMDGIDAALISLSGAPSRPKLRLLAFRTSPYPPKLKQDLLRVAAGGLTSAAEISRLNFEVGRRFADAALAVCRAGGARKSDLSVIGSHGQTIFHQGPRARAGSAADSVASTLQIGEPSVIAERIGVPVVADFRKADVAAGGHGAPLVPLVDYLLLRHPRRGTIALNIGGIANVTVIPPGAEPGDVFGFDTGPGNMIMDALARHFSGGRTSYDKGGRWAARGKIVEDVVVHALSVPYFKQPPPKSAGREQFGQEFVSRYFLNRKHCDPADLLRSAAELTALSIALALKRNIPNRGDFHRLIVSGGGAHNELVLSRLGEFLPGLEVRLSDEVGLPADAKEAMAFALLADRTMHGLPGNLPRVTGARRAVVLGSICNPAR